MKRSTIITPHSKWTYILSVGRTRCDLRRTRERTRRMRIEGWSKSPYTRTFSTDTVICRWSHAEPLPPLWSFWSCNTQQGTTAEHTKKSCHNVLQSNPKAYTHAKLNINVKSDFLRVSLCLVHFRFTNELHHRSFMWKRVSLTCSPLFFVVSATSSRKPPSPKT